MPTVAIIGTEGSGKTVFITTLAKRLSVENKLGAFMNPQDRRTVQYIEKVWTILNNSEWPASTSPGELFELEWTLEWRDGLRVDIRLVDCAGQDLRALFADEQAANPEGMPEQLRQLADYSRAANIVLLMVNLKDFIGESNDERRTSNEWALKYALDLLGSNGAGAHIALVFTQIDQYQEVLRECSDWKNAAKKYLPYVYGAHLRDDRVATMAVASVVDTQVILDNGSPRRVPTPKFRSTGMGTMVKWIGDQAKAVVEKQEAEAKHEAAIREQKEQDDKRVQAAEQRRHKLTSFLKRVGGLAIVAVLLIKGCTWLTSDSPSKGSREREQQGPTAPEPNMVSKDARLVGTGALESFGLEIWGRVRNDGADGNVTIRCEFIQAGQSWPQYVTVRLAHGEYYDFHFTDRTHLWQNSGQVQWKAWAE